MLTFRADVLVGIQMWRFRALLAQNTDIAVEIWYCVEIECAVPEIQILLLFECALVNSDIALWNSRYCWPNSGVRDRILL
jgi:hypothetical protein